MTFPNFPKRSSSEDDTIDQALNAWASSERHSERSEESPRKGLLRCEAAPRPPSAAHSEITDALDFHRWADETRRTDSAATGPAASTWNRVLRSTAQTKNRGGDMNSAALNPERQSAIIQEVRPWKRQQISRYLNNAAMLVIVFGVAFAGALMAMQVNQPGGSDGNFALLGQTDESAACDVEPLSVDRVMEIVKNPFPFMENGPAGEPIEPENHDSPYNNELREADWWDRSLIATGSKSIPSEEVFEESSAFANEYLACLLNGTLGQVWGFYSPISIQEFVLSEFPVFPNEEDVETYLEVKLNSPITENTQYFSWLALSLRSMDAATVTVNSEQELALQQVMWGGTPNTFAIALGVEVTNSNGERVYLSTGTGNELIQHEAGQRNIVISVAWNEPYGHWYILPLSPLSL